MAILTYESVRANVVVRASAVLTAAGAYDAAPVGNICFDADVIDLAYTYTRGAAGGAPKIKILFSVDGGTNYQQALVVDPASYASGVQTLARAEFKLPVSTGAPAESLGVPPIVCSGWTHFQVAGAEYGDTASGATAVLAITATLRKANS